MSEWTKMYRGQAEMDGKKGGKKKSSPKEKKMKKMDMKMSMPATPMRKSVDIKKANNGFIVSSYGEKGETCYIAKDDTEAKEFATKLLAMK